MTKASKPSGHLFVPNPKARFFDFVREELRPTRLNPYLARHSNSSVGMRLASAAQATRTRLASTDRLRGVPRNARREHGQFLLQLRRAAMRAFGSLPVGGAHEDFAVPLAFVTMKFGNDSGPSRG